jgi:23S rRNA (guanosine2251-2'-O)-methyltransferase
MKRLICGPRAVTEALRAAARTIDLLLVADSARGAADAVASEAERKGVALRRCPLAELDALGADLRHQGVIAIAGDYPYLDLDGLLRRAERGPAPPLLLVLDQVQDVHNVGSLLRSAVALGASGVVLCRHGAARVSSAAVRVSAGASEHAAVARVTNLSRSLAELRERGLTTVGLDARAPRAVQEIDLAGPLALVLGGEGAGLRRLVRESCDTLASIPQRGQVASLNVAMAGAIALYEVARQRRKNT